MPLRNRVTPAGEIVAVPERGALMGNRGVLHRDDGTLVRAWQVRRWIACRLEFKGRRRVLLQPRRWTELFFLDEATALAAGHRPCAECRRGDYVRWQIAWEAARLGQPRADAIDRVLHADRLAPGGGKRTFRARASDLPDGTMVALDGAPWRLEGAGLLAWTPGGYTTHRIAPDGPLEVLTPAATVAVIAAGYAPVVDA